MREPSSSRAARNDRRIHLQLVGHLADRAGGSIGQPIQQPDRTGGQVDPGPVLKAVHDSAQRCGIAVSEAREGFPPELPADHPLVRLCVDASGQPACTAPYGTDASELQAIAPCVVLGPGDIVEAHTPTEKVGVADLVAAVPLFMRLAERSAQG